MELFDSPILLKIFSFLSPQELCLGVRLVNRRWRELALDYTLWKTFAVPYHWTDDKLQMYLLIHGESLEELFCACCDNLSSMFFENFAISFSSLENLSRLDLPIMPFESLELCAEKFCQDMSQAYPKLTRINDLPNRCKQCTVILGQSKLPNLKSLQDLPKQQYGRNSITNALEMWSAHMLEVKQNCSNVEEYVVRRGKKMVNDDCISLLSELFPKLRKIELNYCNVTNSGVSALLSKGNGNLEEFLLICNVNYGNLTAVCLEGIGDYAPNLKSLKLVRVKGMTSSILRTIAKSVPQLESFYITLCDDDAEALTDGVVEELSLQCSLLRHFRVIGASTLTSSAISRLVLNCSHLTAVLLYNCTQMTDVALMHLTTCSQLRSLTLVNTPMITPSGVLYLVLRAPRLLRLLLDLRSVAFLSTCAQEHAQICEQLDLAQLLPSVVTHVTALVVSGGFLQLLTVLCPRLQVLVINSSLTTDTLCTILTNCEGLQKLDLSSVKFDKSAEVTSCLANHGLQLHSVDFGDFLLTKDGLLPMLENCKLLRTLGFVCDRREIAEDLKEVVAVKRKGCFLHWDRSYTGSAEQKLRFELKFLPAIYLNSIP